MGFLLSRKKEFDENVVGKDSDQASSKQSFESSDVCQFSRFSQNSFSKQGTCTCFESNIVIILTISFAITIKLLQLFEGIVTRFNDVLNRPSIFHNKSECFYYA